MAFPYTNLERLNKKMLLFSKEMMEDILKYYFKTNSIKLRMKCTYNSIEQILHPLLKWFVLALIVIIFHYFQSKIILAFQEHLVWIKASLVHDCHQVSSLICERKVIHLISFIHITYNISAKFIHDKVNCYYL